MSSINPKYKFYARITYNYLNEADGNGEDFEMLDITPNTLLNCVTKINNKRNHDIATHKQGEYVCYNCIGSSCGFEITYELNIFVSLLSIILAISVKE